MSKEDNSGGESQDTFGPDVPSDMPTKDPSKNVYDNRGPKKIIRVVTVIAYLFSVSFVGIILSAYYIFLWEPPNPRVIGHPRANPQFLIAAAPKVPDPKEKETIDSSLENEPNRTFDSLLGRAITQGTYDGDSTGIGLTKVNQRRSDKISLEKQERLGSMLFKLRQSLVKVLRAQKRNSSRQVPNGASDSLIQAKRLHNSAKETDQGALWVSVGRDESRGNIVRKYKNDNTDPPSEFTGSMKALNASKLATIPGTKTNHGDFDGESENSTQTAIDRETMRPNYERELDVQRFSKIHAFRQESSKQDETDDGRLIAAIANKEENPNRDPNDVHSTNATIVLGLEKYVENQSATPLASTVNANINRSGLNDRNDNANSSNRMKRVMRGRASVGSPLPSDLEDPEFDHGLPNSPTVVKPALYTTKNIQGEKIHVSMSFISFS